MLGQKIRELREAKGLVQRQVAAKLDVDIAYVSKMESNEKPVSRSHLGKLAKLLEVPEQELHALWLADKVLKTLGEEDHKSEALHIAMQSIHGGL